MNVLSLPDEMVASIGKYADAGAVATLRKMNRYLNRLAQNYHFDKVAADWITVSRFETDEEKIRIDIGVRGCQDLHLYVISASSSWENLAYFYKLLLSKVRKVSDVSVINVDLDCDALALLKFEASSMRNAKISIEFCKILAPVTMLSRTFSVYKNVSFVENIWPMYGGITVSDKIVSSLFSLYSIVNFSADVETAIINKSVTDTTLDHLFKMAPAGFSMKNVTSTITAEALFAFLKNIAKFPSDAHYHLGIVTMKYKQDALAQIKLLKQIKGANVQIRDRGNSVESKLGLYNKRIKFVIDIPAEEEGAAMEEE